ncbi:MAG TPA: AAA family ATPase [Thermoclostridium sp.]
MSKLSLFIADPDRGCVQSLVEYFSQFEREYFYKVQGFTNPIELKEAVKQEQPDILLIDPNMISDHISFKDITVTILLDDGTLPFGFENYHHINKYKQARDISTFIMSTYTKVSKKTITSADKGKVTVISVYSPIGGVGKTSVAVGLAKAFAESGDRVLYINLEDTPSTNFYFNGDNQNSNFSDVLYELIKSRPNLSAVLTGAQNISSDGVSFIFPQENSTELYELNKSQWLNFIGQLHDIELFNRVIIDMSSSLDLKNLSVLSASDHIVLLGRRNGNATVKLSLFEKYCMNMSIEFFDLKKNLDKFYPVENITDNRDMSRDNMQEIKIFEKPFGYQIPFDKYLALYGTADMSYKFGDAVRALKNKLSEV